MISYMVAKLKGEKGQICKKKNWWGERRNMRRGAYRAGASDGDGMQSVGVRRGRFTERGRLSRAQHGVRATVVGRALRGVRADDESTNVY